MTPSHHRRTSAPLGRTDSTRPPRTHHKSSLSAPATTRPGTRRAHVTTTAPIPATVWACGPTPIDPRSVWPTPIVNKIVTSFSKPGGRVVLLPWPTIPAAAPAVIDHTGVTEPDTELATALTEIAELGRTVRVARIEPKPITYGPASRPFCADLVHDPDHTGAPQPGAPHAAPHRLDPDARDTDVIITSLRPEHSRTHASDHLRDHIARFAARLLRLRGILVVLTHSDWSHGELVDPTGPVVASAQHADLLYLQHIIALHTPIRDGHLLGHPTNPAVSDEARSQHPAWTPGLAQPHHRISSDILVFTQPRDHQPPPLTLAAAPCLTPTSSDEPHPTPPPHQLPYQEGHLRD
jgi:hypothetical protein